jgi:hypothetical protein
LDVWSRLHNDYRAQAVRPFEHEARLKELLARQAQLNATLVSTRATQATENSRLRTSSPALAPAVFQASQLFFIKMGGTRNIAGG